MNVYQLVDIFYFPCYTVPMNTKNVTIYGTAIYIESVCCTTREAMARELDGVTMVKLSFKESNPRLMMQFNSVCKDKGIEKYDRYAS